MMLAAIGEDRVDKGDLGGSKKWMGNGDSHPLLTCSQLILTQPEKWPPASPFPKGGDRSMPKVTQ